MLLQVCGPPTGPKAEAPGLGEAQLGQMTRSASATGRSQRAGLISYHIKRGQGFHSFVVREVSAEVSTAQVLSHIHTGYFDFAVYT